MINVLYYVDEIEITATSIQSLLKNTNSDVTIHLLYKNLETIDRTRFIDLIRRFKQRIIFYSQNQLAQKFPKDIPRIIFISSKMLVDLDINALWNFEIEDNFVAAVSINEKFDSNIMIINLNQIRLMGQENLIPQILDATHKHDFSVNRFLQLPEKFNTPIGKSFERGKIYRFIERPTFNAKDPFNELFTSHFIQTPFCNPDSFGNIFNDKIHALEELQKSTAEILNSIQREIKSKT